MKHPHSPLAARAPDATQRKHAMQSTLAAIIKTHGEGSIAYLGARPRLDLPFLPTGCLPLDLALGLGGLPRGRMVEIIGPESSGKTTLCLSVIAEAQRRGGVAAFIDVEHALDPKFARVAGVDINSLLVSQPDSGEEALTVMETLVRSNAIDVIVLDSVAALTTRAELDGQMGDATMGSQARLMSQAMRRLTAAVSKSQCVVIFTNQIREKIGVMFGSSETTPGGRALKFFSSVRLDIRRTDTLKSPEGKPFGLLTRIKVIKNKVGAPFTECAAEILFAEGISRIGGLLDLAVGAKLIEKKGAWFSYQGQLLGQGREDTKRTLANDFGLTQELEATLRGTTRAAVGQRLAEPVAIPAEVREPNVLLPGDSVDVIIGTLE